MMRISLLKTALRNAFFMVAMAIGQLSFGQQNLTFDIQNRVVGDTVIAEFKTFDFTNILSMQFTLEWDETEMEFAYLEGFALPGLTAANYNTNFAPEGLLTFSWFDPNVAGVTIPECAVLFSIKYVSLNGNSTPVVIDNSPTADEITDGDFNVLPWAQTPLNCGLVQGGVVRDLDDNCYADAGETPLANWKIQFEKDGQVYYGSTDNNGYYSLSLPSGEYTASLVFPTKDIWGSCSPSKTITVDSAITTVTHFPVEALVDCPLMSVDLSAPFLRRCFSNNYYVKYCNEGTITAEDALIEVTLDPMLNVLGSSIPWSSVNGQVYTFEIGDVASGECGTFFIEVEVSCDAVLGQTHCSSAHVFPDAPCIPSINWDGSDLDVTGTCEGDSVRFEIKNLGDDMAQPVEFIVIEDDMIHLTSEPVQLLSQQSVQLAVTANGSTWRVEVPETPDNPFGTFSTAAIEGCGTNGNGQFSLGFVTQFPQDDQPLAIDEDCQENRGAFDPNDKTGYPKGFCQANYIRSDQEIEYRIRFQNTGTDTAFNITVTDTLSNFLQPASVRPGSSSHPYEFSLLGEGVVRFTFPNIMLPDSTTNEPASHGFVKFSVQQRSGNPAGTMIENYAGIYFDFNEPIHTNVTRHTVGDAFVEMQSATGDLSVTGNVSMWWGEPIDSVQMIMSNLCPVLTDVDGNFEFVDIDTADYSLTAYKVNDNSRKGVTVLDMLKMRSNILGISNEFNEFQRTAADVNGSGGVTTFDLVTISKYVLGITDALSPNWRFVTTDSDPNDISTWSSAYYYTPLDTDQTGQDFWAIQPGNLLDESMVPKVPINTQFRFETTVTSNNLIRVEVKAKEYTTVEAFQYGLKWDANVMGFLSIESGAVSMPANANNLYSVQGRLSLWYIRNTGEAHTIGENETLFTLVFDALAPNGTTTTLELDESVTPLQVIVDTCKLADPSVLSTDITIEPTAVIDFAETGLQVKVAPNPVRHGQPIQLEVASENAQAINLHLFGLSGAAKASVQLNVPAGRSFHTFPESMSKGIYFLKIMDGSGKERTAKVVVF